MVDSSKGPLRATLAEENAYLSNHSLTTLEAEVLAEYARMASVLEKLANVANKLSMSQPEILEQLRPLEKKLGLVLTLFKASVWATYVAQDAQDEQEETNY